MGARRAFPCFDEPAYKVPWKLTIRANKNHTALANAPVTSETLGLDGLKIVAFEETKPLPSYLVAFVVGPFELVNAKPAGHHDTPLRFVVPKGHGPETRYAAEVTPRIVGLLEDYFGMPYPRRLHRSQPGQGVARPAPRRHVRSARIRRHPHGPCL